MASGTSEKDMTESSSLEPQDKQLNINWDDVICPICLDFPHNRVLLQCSSYRKGCQPFICDTDPTHSNCLDRFKSANGVRAAKGPPTPNGVSAESSQTIVLNSDSHPTCPLCRGEVTGWVVVDEARVHLNMKKRCCEEKQCSFVGNYTELQLHGKQEHPNARPSEVDPERQLEWENFQQSSEIMDVLSTIHSEVHGMVLGDYVIEYRNDSGDEYEDFPGDDGNWWTSCILYHAFDSFFRASRNRRRSRTSEPRRNHRRSRNDASNMGGSSSSSPDISESHFDDIDDESAGAGGGGGASRRRATRRRLY